MGSRILTGLLVAALAAPVAVRAADAPAKGAALLLPYKEALQRALKAGLAEGPVAAIAACRERAPEIAAQLSQDGVRVGRSSHRLRNPANAPPAWVAPILEAWLPEGADRTPQSVALGERQGYVEPIYLQPLCASCHGESLAPEVATRIHELYPEDRAVGFRPGDLRGVFWVEFPAEAAP